MMFARNDLADTGSPPASCISRFSWLTLDVLIARIGLSLDNDPEAEEAASLLPFEKVPGIIAAGLLLLSWDKCEIRARIQGVSSAVEKNAFTASEVYL
jgi:hypothetical protein